MSITAVQSRKIYEHGDEVNVHCDDGYAFENDEDSISLLCLNRKWHSKRAKKIPRCLRYSNCIFFKKENLKIFGKDLIRKNHDITVIGHRVTAR